jgi:hypothetical protein
MKAAVRCGQESIAAKSLANGSEAPPLSILPEAAGAFGPLVGRLLIEDPDRGARAHWTIAILQLNVPEADRHAE